VVTGTAIDLGGLLDRAAARSRIAAVLHDVLRDVIGAGLLDPGCPDDVESNAALVDAIDAATNDALETLADRVEPVLAACDDATLARVALDRLWRELGGD
jgi:hypothetical protein